MRPAHFAPALAGAMRRHLAELDAIAAEPGEPTSADTIVAFDASGRALARVAAVFGNLTKSETSPELQAAERELAPRLAAHESAVNLHEGLFRRIDGLHARRDELGLAPETALSEEGEPAPRMQGLPLV